MCTIKRAKKTISILTIIALLSHLYSFVIAGLVTNRNGYEVCDLREDYLQTMHIISIIDSIVSLIVPLVLIVGMNTMIMKKLVKFSRQFNQQSGYVANCPERNSDINLGQIPVSSLLHTSILNCSLILCMYAIIPNVSELILKGSYARNMAIIT